MTGSFENPGERHLSVVRSPEESRELPMGVRLAHAYANELLWDEFGIPLPYACNTRTPMRHGESRYNEVHFQIVNNKYALLYYKADNKEQAAYEIVLQRYDSMPLEERPARPSGRHEWCVSFGQPEDDMSISYTFDLRFFTVELQDRWGKLPLEITQRFGLEQP